MEGCLKIDGWQLLAYLDQRASPEIMAHIAACPECSARAAQLAGEQPGHASRLAYQLGCPSKMDLGEYHLGWLPAQRAAEVGQHVAECPRCNAALQRLSSFLADPLFDLVSQAEPAPGLLARLRVWVAEWVPPALTPAYGLRGSAAAGGLYRAGGVQIALEVQDDLDLPGCKILLGLVSGSDWRNGQVFLQSRERDEPAQPAEIDSLGNFVLSGLRPGSYQLRLIGAEAEIQITTVTC